MTGLYLVLTVLTMIHTPGVKGNGCRGVSGVYVCDPTNPTRFAICIGEHRYTMTCPGVSSSTSVPRCVTGLTVHPATPPLRPPSPPSSPPSPPSSPHSASHRQLQKVKLENYHALRESWPDSGAGSARHTDVNEQNIGHADVTSGNSKYDDAISGKYKHGDVNAENNDYGDISSGNYHHSGDVSAEITLTKKQGINQFKASDGARGDSNGRSGSDGSGKDARSGSDGRGRDGRNGSNGSGRIGVEGQTPTLTPVPSPADYSQRSQDPHSHDLHRPDSRTPGDMSTHTAQDTRHYARQAEDFTRGQHSYAHKESTPHSHSHSRSHPQTQRAQRHLQSHHTERFPQLTQRYAQVTQRQPQPSQRHAQVTQRQPQPSQRHAQVTQRQPQPSQRHAQVTQRQPQLTQRHAQVTQRQPQLTQRYAQVTQRQSQPSQKYAQVTQRQSQRVSGRSHQKADDGYNRYMNIAARKRKLRHSTTEEGWKAHKGDHDNNQIMNNNHKIHRTDNNHKINNNDKNHKINNNDNHHKVNNNDNNHKINNIDDHHEINNNDDNNQDHDDHRIKASSHHGHAHAVVGDGAANLQAMNKKQDHHDNESGKQDDKDTQEKADRFSLAQQPWWISAPSKSSTPTRLDGQSSTAKRGGSRALWSSAAARSRGSESRAAARSRGSRSRASGLRVSGSRVPARSRALRSRVPGSLTGLLPAYPPAAKHADADPAPQASPRRRHKTSSSESTRRKGSRDQPARYSPSPGKTRSESKPINAAAASGPRRRTNARKPGRCSPDTCKLPKCRCAGTDIPGNLPADHTPQMILLTFDDSVNEANYHYYSRLFQEVPATNPNGCPARATFFVSGDATRYGMVAKLHKAGHEMASHSLSHRSPTTYWAHAGYDAYLHEIEGMRKKLETKSHVPRQHVRGMRVPFLQVGGDAQYQMLHDLGYAYDSSMVTGRLYRNTDPPLWPFTLDYPPTSKVCSLTPCPTRSYPGLWEVPLVRWYGTNRLACAMPDACSTGHGKKGILKYLHDNFQRHYSTNRAPMGIFLHATWFGRKEGSVEGLLEFLRDVTAKGDVWVLTVSQMLAWVSHPVPVNMTHSIPTWGCSP